MRPFYALYKISPLNPPHLPTLLKFYYSAFFPLIMLIQPHLKTMIAWLLSTRLLVFIQIFLRLLLNMVYVYVDGSCSKPDDSTFHRGYPVCSLTNTVWDVHLLPFKSAQTAELVAFTHTCSLFAEQVVTIYTDSRYAFGVAHNYGKFCHACGVHSAYGKPISYSTLVSDLLQTCTFPSS